MRQLFVPFLLCVTLVLGSAPALADPDAATRASARTLGEEGNALFDKGEWAQALEKYQRAMALVEVPTLGVRIARCLTKLGRLVEASEQYLAVTRMKLGDKALDVHKEALVQAAAEREALLPRVPSLVITLKGAQDAEVSVDGKTVPPALLGQRRNVDPGKHRVVARRGAEQQTRDVEVAEGQSVPVTFELAEGAPSSPGAPEPTPSRPAPAKSARGDAAADPGGTQRVLAYVALGLGGVGLGLGATTGIMASSRKSDLEKDCGSDLECPPAKHSDADSYNSLRTLSSIGFIGGGVAAAAGLTLLLTAPKPERAARVSPWLGVGSAGVRGTF